MRRLWHRMWPVDWLHLAFLSSHLVLQVFTHGRMENWAFWTVFDACALVLLAWIVGSSDGSRPRREALLRIGHGCLIPLIFTQVGLTIKALDLPDFARQMEAIDRWIFGGVNPIEALEALASPWLTEIMQWGYAAYILMAPAVGVLLLLKADPETIARSLFSLLSVFYLSYVGYYLLPTSGPNIHNNLGPILPCDVPSLPLYEFESDLPGVWLAEPLRRWMFEVELTKKDCFPSGHTAIAVAATVLAFRTGRRYGFLFLPFALGVVLSTMYLRYHYVIDVVAGVALAWVCTGPLCRLHRRLEPVVSSNPPPPS